MTLSPAVLSVLSAPRPHRKGASVAEIAADIAKQATTNRLISEVNGKQLGGKA